MTESENKFRDNFDNRQDIVAKSLEQGMPLSFILPLSMKKSEKVSALLYYLNGQEGNKTRDDKIRLLSAQIGEIGLIFEDPWNYSRRKRQGFFGR